MAAMRRARSSSRGAQPLRAGPARGAPKATTRAARGGGCGQNVRGMADHVRGAVTAVAANDGLSMGHIVTSRRLLGLAPALV